MPTDSSPRAARSSAAAASASTSPTLSHSPQTLSPEACFVDLESGSKNNAAMASAMPANGTATLNGRTSRNSQNEIRRRAPRTVRIDDDPPNIISLRYRADSMTDSVSNEVNTGAEAKVWSAFEKVFCFLKGMTIYQTRRRLKAIIVAQAATCTFRIVPIILGLSYQTTVPVMILYVTLVLGWHGTKFLSPKFLLLYKIGMQLSLFVDLVWYVAGYNGNFTSVSRGTSLYMQVFLSIILTFLNIAGLLYGWKLRRIVKAVQNHRPSDRATLATMVPPSSPTTGESHLTSINRLRSRISRLSHADAAGLDEEEDDENTRRRAIKVGCLPRVEEPTNANANLNAKAKNKNKNKNKHKTPEFCSNIIRTSKYTLYNFPFVFLKMQFSRLANFYTTIVVALCFFDFSPVSPLASLTPLLIVFATSAAKDFAEDLRRKREDNKVNSKSAHIVRREDSPLPGVKHVDGMWKDIAVGDLLILTHGDEVPADCILLGTSRADGRTYVETSNLDGETNLKIRSVPSCTKKLLSAENILEKHLLAVECDLPSKDLFAFDGVLRVTKSSDAKSKSAMLRDEPESTRESSGDGSVGGGDATTSPSNQQQQRDVGREETHANESSLCMNNVLLRGSEIRNVEWSIGLVIYTGKETKIALNASNVPLKRSYVERTLDTMFVLVLILLFTIALACTLGNNDWDWKEDTSSTNSSSADNAPYLDGSTKAKETDYIFLSFVILFNNLIPLSMYVTMEGVRFVHARFIENDLEMYDESQDTPAQVRNSNINEDLGQVQYIFSDKTGTLTRNEMVFAKCTIAGLRYNDIDTDVDVPSRPGTRFNDNRLLARLNSNHSTKKDINDFLLLLTICNTVIPENTSAAASRESRGSISSHSSKHLSPLSAEAKTTYNELNHSTENISYQASSPDEKALVLAAKDLGYVFVSRDGPICHVLIHGEPATYEILNVLEFNSDRKRMSVIVRFPDRSIRLYCKGADDVIFTLLSQRQPQGVAHVTRGHLQEYASEGLRTLTMAVRELSEQDYDMWYRQYREAELSMHDRAAKVARISAMVEVDLILLGATAIEDRLQEGVEESICSFRKAGINFWVLTGDKKETALSIGMSSHVIDDNMDVIVLSQREKHELRSKLEELYVDLVDDKWGSDENASAFSVLYEATKRALMMAYMTIKTALVGRDQEDQKKKKRIRSHRPMQNAPSSVAESSSQDPQQSGNHQLSTDTEGVYPRSESEMSETTGANAHDVGIGIQETTVDRTFEPNGAAVEHELSHDEELEYAMVIDGKTLALLLEDDIKYLFLAVATQCKSVICCRCSPSQKADVVKLVTEPTLMFSPGNISLAIGDGANDVPMIQAANIGVGISGKEGRQAVLSSDYSFSQFRFLKRLLLVHGNYSYKRISKLILFSFMKNVALSMSNFFLAIQSKYSGLLMYFSIFFTLYNALFTTIPIVVIAMYNQDVSPVVLMQYPSLYVNGLKNRSFNWVSFFGWCLLGVWHAYVIFAVPFSTNGYLSDMLRVYTDAGNLLFNDEDLGLWACGVASYTFLICASTAQVSLMTSNWTRPNAVATLGTLVFYFAFLAFFCNLYYWVRADFYEIQIGYAVFNHLVMKPWFWFGLVLATIVATLPNYIAKAFKVLFYPEPSHLMREWNRFAKTDDPAVMMASPRLVRRNTGFAFSHYPGESEMALFRQTARGSSLMSGGSGRTSVASTTTLPAPGTGTGTTTNGASRPSRLERSGN